MSGDHHRPRLTLIGITIVSYVAIFTLVAVAGLRVDYSSIVPPILWIGGATILCSAYGSWRNMLALRNVVEPICLGLMLTVPTVLSTYLALGTGMPPADERLAAIDASLGFDWTAFVGFVEAHRWLAHGLGLAYQSFMFQLLAVPVLLSVVGRAERAYRTVVAYALICFAASFVAIWFPAIGAYPYYKIAPGSLQNINMHFGYFFLDQFHGVREDPDFVFSVTDAAGILTFPSVHAATAALCAWAVWEIRLLRYPMLLLNAGMAVAAISHGSHYMVDIPAGVLLAAACIASVSVVARKVRPTIGAPTAVTA